MHRELNATSRLLGLGGSLLGLQHLDDDLLLLNQEGAHDTLPQAAVAQDSSVGPADGLLALGHAWPLAGAAGPDALQLLLALTALGHITAFLHVLVDQTAAGCANTKRKRRMGISNRALGSHQGAGEHGTLTHDVCSSLCCTTVVDGGSIAEPYLGCKKQGKYN